MERNRKLGLQPTKLGTSLRFSPLCLRMVTRCRDRDQKQFYPQFRIGCHIAVVNEKKVLFPKMSRTRRNGKDMNVRVMHVLFPELCSHCYKVMSYVISVMSDAPEITRFSVYISETLEWYAEEACEYVTVF